MYIQLAPEEELEKRNRRLLKESVGVAESIELLMMEVKFLEDKNKTYPKNFNMEALKKLVRELKSTSEAAKECGNVLRQLEDKAAFMK